MDPQMIFLVGLQVAYWLWGSIIQPGTVKFGAKVADALGDVLANGVFDLFGKEPPKAKNGKLDESLDQQKKQEKLVLPKIKSNPIKAEKVLAETQRTLVILLRDPTYFSMEYLNLLWQDVLDPTVDWKSKIISSPSQAAIAGELVAGATRKNKLAELISSMRKIQES